MAGVVSLEILTSRAVYAGIGKDKWRTDRLLEDVILVAINAQLDALGEWGGVAHNDMLLLLEGTLSALVGCAR